MNSIVTTAPTTKAATFAFAIMFQKRCAKNRCQCWGPKFHIRLCRSTPAPPTGVAKVTGQQAETSLTPVRSTARGVVSGPPVKVSDGNVIISVKCMCMYIILCRT